MNKSIEIYKQRFDKKIKKTPSCWIWTGKKQPNGNGTLYGRAGFNNKLYAATHLAYYFATGKWPKHQINHTCHNSLCVNPAHLYDGTQKENVQDMWRANRQRYKPQCGQDNGMAKLTLKQVKAIRRKYATGRYTLMRLAKQYHVSYVNIWYIVTEATWRN